MVSLEFPVEMTFWPPWTTGGRYLDNRGRLVEGPCTSGGGRAPVHKSNALS